MSHQTGITASDGVKDFFGVAKSPDGNIRLIKIGICLESEEMILLDSRSVNGTWEEDFDGTILEVIEEQQPCYIFYRLDSRNDLGYEWLFIPYSPDDSPTRAKMVFSATRSTIKMEFGGGCIVDECFCTTLAEISLGGYRKHVAGKQVAAPLTIAEEELQEVKQAHIEAAAGKANRLPGVSFPMDDGAIDEIIKLANKEISYVQLSIDVEKETIYLSKACDLDVAQLQGEIPKDKPAYHFFIFKHTFEGDYLESIVFIYSMPGYKASIKERMLYSSCKGTLLSSLEEELKLEIAKKIEIDEDDHVDETILFDQVHPQKNIVREKFSKPKGPGNRGPRRMIKTSASDQ